MSSSLGRSTAMSSSLDRPTVVWTAGVVVVVALTPSAVACTRSAASWLASLMVLASIYTLRHFSLNGNPE